MEFMRVLLDDAVKCFCLEALVAPRQKHHFLLPGLGLTLAPDLPAIALVGSWPTIEDDDAGEGAEADFLGLPLDSFFISLDMEASCRECVSHINTHRPVWFPDKDVVFQN